MEREFSIKAGNEDGRAALFTTLRNAGPAYNAMNHANKIRRLRLKNAGSTVWDLQCRFYTHYA